jgi:17beta-estradiol 17-dehydrogenase / very-long-chain 3-oxoacyl-CoA reductase
MFDQVALILGYAILAYLLLRLVLAIFGKLFFKKNFQNTYGQGTWAIITGASDGIGKGFAFILAKRGFNLVLIARSGEKLEKVKQEIAQAHPNVEIKYIIADFKNSLQPYFVEKIYDQVKDLEISFLVNNVGVALIEHFSETPIDKIQELFIVNMAPQLLLSHKIIPLMQKRDKRSGIVNVSSMTGLCPLPYDAVYSASKAFTDFLSRALSVEYQKKIDIISLRPFYVSTKMVFNREPGIFTITPEECAEGCLEDLGYQYETYGHFKHAIQGFVWDIVPKWIVMRAMRFVGPLISQDFKENMRKLQ